MRYIIPIILQSSPLECLQTGNEQPAHKRAQHPTRWGNSSKGSDPSVYVLLYMFASYHLPPQQFYRVTTNHSEYTNTINDTSAFTSRPYATSLPKSSIVKHSKWKQAVNLHFAFVPRLQRSKYRRATDAIA